MTCLNFLSLLTQQPDAFANISGNPDYPDLDGVVKFYKTDVGIVVISQVSGLPTNENSCEKPIFAFHIHEGTSCSGNDIDFFADAKTHYNPNSCHHPYHAGDMPPLFDANGLAFSAFLTDRFTIDEIIGKTVIIHSSPDDFTTQPSGNAGTKIACGVIEEY